MTLFLIDLTTASEKMKPFTIFILTIRKHVQWYQTVVLTHLEKSYGNCHINTKLKTNLKNKFSYVSNEHFFQLVSEILTNIEIGDDDDIDIN